MHHTEHMEHTIALVVAVMLILKKIIVTTVAQEWTVIQNVSKI